MGLKPRRTSELPVLVAERVELHPVRGEHAAALFALVDQNRERLGEWLPWVDSTLDVTATAEFARQTRTAHRAGTAFRCVVMLQSEVVGVVSLESINTFHGHGQVGYWLAAGAVGRGLMTEAVRAIVTYGFEERGLNLIEIRAGTGNRRSRAVPERLGFHFDGVLRQREKVGAAYLDHAVYSMLASEWRAR